MIGAPESDELRERLAQLTTRVNALEQRLGVEPPPVDPAPSPRQAVVPEAAPAPQPAPPSVAAPAREPALFTLTESAREESFELRVGRRWFSYLGAVAVVLGLAVLFRLAIVNDWLGLAERVVAGVLLGYALAGAGERLDRKGYPVAGYALSAVGTAAAYLSLWAGNVLYHVVPAGLALAGMALVTAYNAWVALAKSSQRYTALGLLGAFLAPVLLGSRENHEILLFLYVLSLDAAVALLAARRRWNWLLPAALVATLVLAAVWASRWYDATERGVTCAFIAAFLMLFSLGARAARGLRAEDEAPPQELSLILPLLTAGAAWMSLAIVLTAPPVGQAWFWRIPGLLALWYLALYAWPAREVDAGVSAWRWTQFALAVALATAALTLKFSGRELIVAWLFEGIVLATAAAGPRDRAPLRGFAAVLLLVAGCATVMANPYAGPRVLWNPRFGIYALAFCTIAATAALAFRRARRAESAGGHRAGWPNVAALLAAVAALLPLFAGWFELQTFWWGAMHDLYVASALAAELTFRSQLSYSLWCMLYAAALLAFGSWRSWSPMRWLALALLALAIAKVLLYDLSRLGLAYRVVSLLALGALLLAISYLYQRGAIARRDE